MCESLTENKKKMITELTPEQQARMPEYVEKWTKIGLSTEPCDFEASKKHIADAYRVAKLEPPKYWFYFSSPDASTHAIFMVDQLTAFDNSYTDKTVYGEDNSKWLPIFEKMYEQYSAQYQEKDVVWNDDTKARMLSFISKAYTRSDVAEQRKQHFEKMLFGNHDASWLSFYDFFYQEFDLECTHDLIPSFELAKVCGWWSPYEEAAFVQDRPCKISLNDRKVLHDLNGPAIEYPDGSKIYCIEGFWFPEYVVMDPNKITVEEIDKESNAEKRRILLQQYGYQRYFDNAQCELLDHDEVRVSENDDRKMPRMLIRTKHGDTYLVGTDGSTNRTYFMNISSNDSIDRIESRFGKIKTCKKAHELISGLNDEDCLAQS